MAHGAYISWSFLLCTRLFEVISDLPASAGGREGAGGRSGGRVGGVISDLPASAGGCEEAGGRSGGRVGGVQASPCLRATSSMAASLM